MSAIVEFRNVAYAINGRALLHDVSFQIESGEVGTASAADRKLRVLHELSNQNGGRGGPGHPREQTRIEPAHHEVTSIPCRRIDRVK